MLRADADDREVLLRLVDRGAQHVDAHVARGGDAYHALGFSQSRGTKVVSLNSLFVSPGLYEIEFGMPVRQILEELGGGVREPASNCAPVGFMA